MAHIGNLEQEERNGSMVKQINKFIEIYLAASIGQYDILVCMCGILVEATSVCVYIYLNLEELMNLKKCKSGRRTVTNRETMTMFHKTQMCLGPKNPTIRVNPSKAEI